MTTTDERRRRAAKAFVERWTFRRGSEKGEDQQFWNDLLRSVLGVEDVESRIRYQVPMGGSPSPATAKREGRGAFPVRPFGERIRWVVTCNFDRFEIHDRAKPLVPPLVQRHRDRFACSDAPRRGWRGYFARRAVRMWRMNQRASQPQNHSPCPRALRVDWPEGADATERVPP